MSKHIQQITAHGSIVMSTHNISEKYSLPDEGKN